MSADVIPGAIPGPTALPRFSLPDDSRSSFASGADPGSGSSEWDDDDANDTIDPLDVAKTTQRHTLDPVRARMVLRRAAPVVTGPVLEPDADTTSEVQVEDILLEAYAEDPPPPSRRATAIASVPERIVTPPAHLSIAAAIASSAPPYQAQSEAVDALLRHSDPMFAPHPATLHHAPAAGAMGGAPLHFIATPGPVAFPAPGFAAYEEESHSVAPVAFPSISEMRALGAPSGDHAYHARGSHAHPSFASSFGTPVAASAPVPRSSGAATMVAAALLAFSAVGLGVGVTVAIRTGAFAAWKASAEQAAHGFASKHAPASATPAAPAPAPIAPPASPTTTAVAAVQPSAVQASAVQASAVQPASVPPAVAPPVPSMAVDALPKPVVPANSTLVTFPASAQGHRVFFDGRPLAVEGSAPVMLRCGRHMIRIGSRGTPRVTDLVCGTEQSLTR